MMPSGTKFVVTDIDGTMTASDDELFKEIDDGSYVPVENPSADVLMNDWASKGYQVVFLTARPHVFRAETRQWLHDKGFPTGPVITANSLVFGDSAREYKGAWVKRMTTVFGWTVVAAYGNAESDVQAYEDAGIPKNITFTVGEATGHLGHRRHSQQRLRSAHHRLRRSAARQPLSDPGGPPAPTDRALAHHDGGDPSRWGRPCAATKASPTEAKMASPIMP